MGFEEIFYSGREVRNMQKLADRQTDRQTDR
jgi:hypothetical protein